MEPVFSFTDAQRDELFHLLSAVAKNPYEDYSAFSAAVGDVLARGEVPAYFLQACATVRAQRESGESDAHVLRNCPVDAEIPLFEQDDPVADKYRKKTTFVGETFLELFGQVVGTPLLAYETRNNGDFFHDVYAVNRYTGTQTQKTDSELYFHNDRTAHPVRADFLALLGMRCPVEDQIYTGFADGRDVLANLTDEHQQTLRQPLFITPFDRYSRDSNSTQTVSEPHAILENDHSLRYYDTRTRVAPDAPIAAYEALLALKNAIVKSKKRRHKILDRDLFVLANQDGLHSRDMVEILDPERARQRWLLKTYAFRDQSAADRHNSDWLDGVVGRVAD
ncbi:TauD/TfdA family dioxygenase [Streptacidiphilus rugosus]|uniref:TauD/TfdA family dioxygenase n=1 Tax=Streptacidiphilus rugosus TaxID=405783 RepID=UPI00056631FE|nr:TauD/TfdA family dioxygenase [Streptacidiphilus rugosus]